MSGRCGFEEKEEMSVCGEIRLVTPGKWVSKKAGTVEGLHSRVEMWAEGRKRVHVKDPSCYLLVCDYNRGAWVRDNARNGDEHEFFAGPDM